MMIEIGPELANTVFSCSIVFLIVFFLYILKIKWTLAAKIRLRVIEASEKTGRSLRFKDGLNERD